MAYNYDYDSDVRDVRFSIGERMFLFDALSTLLLYNRGFQVGKENCKRAELIQNKLEATFKA